jgi:hypothetical protein
MAKEKITKTNTEEIIKNVSNNHEELNVKEFMLKKAADQENIIKETLEKMYEGNVKVEKKHIEKILNIAFDNKDNEVYLPNSLMVSKEGNKLVFSFKKRKYGLLIIVFFASFLLLSGFATYTGVQFWKMRNMNIDLDGDGVADLNISLNNNGICDINCDTNNDRRPDVNIDYHSNRNPMFNVKQSDGTIKVNVNLDTNGDGVCDINCDSNNDGWPDYNIDFDGDGIADLDRDINGDKIKDLDIDLDGDGICDLNCDTTKNNKCDNKCTSIEITNNGNGLSSSTGNSGFNIASASLLVVYENIDSVSATMIYPDDQPEGEDITTTIPDIKFFVTNTTDNELEFNIDWTDITNTYTSENFQFKLTRNNQTLIDWKAVPTSDSTMTTLRIPANAKQTFVVSFRLHGTNDDQYYDQGKIFKGRIFVDINKDETE